MSEHRNATTRASVPSSGYARACVQKSVAAICAAHGWQSATREALQVLTILFEQRLSQLARLTTAVASHAESDSPGVYDVQYVFEALGVTSKELVEYATFCSKPPISYPGEQLQFPAPSTSNLRFDASVVEVDQSDAANGNNVQSVYGRLADAEYELLDRAFPQVEPFFPTIASVPNWKTLALARIRRNEAEEAQREANSETGRPNEEVRANDVEMRSRDESANAKAIEGEQQSNRLPIIQPEDINGLQPITHAFDEADAEELERIGAQLDAEHTARFSGCFALFGGSARRRDRRRMDEPPMTNGTHPRPFYALTGAQPRSPVKALLFPFRRGRARESETESDFDSSRKRSRRRSASSASSNDRRRRSSHSRRHSHRSHRNSRSHRHDSHSRRHRHRHRDRDSEKEPAAANDSSKAVILPKLKLKLCDPSQEDRFQIVDASAREAQISNDGEIKSTRPELGDLGSSAIGKIPPPVSAAASGSPFNFDAAEYRAPEAEPPAKELQASRSEQVTSSGRVKSSSKSRKKSVKSPLPVEMPDAVASEDKTSAWNESQATMNRASQLLVADSSPMDTSRPEHAPPVEAAPKLKLKFKLGPPPRSSTDGAETSLSITLPGSNSQSNTNVPNTPFSAEMSASARSRSAVADSNPFLSEWSDSNRLFSSIDALPQHHSSKQSVAHEAQKSPVAANAQHGFFQGSTSRGMLPTMVRGPEFAEFSKIYPSPAVAANAGKSSPPRLGGAPLSPQANLPVEPTHMNVEQQNQPINLSMKAPNGKRRSDAQAKSAVSLTPIVSKSSKKSHKQKSSTEVHADETQHSVTLHGSSTKQAAADSRKQSAANPSTGSSFVTMTAPPTVWSDTLALPPLPVAASGVQGAEPSPSQSHSHSTSNNKSRNKKSQSKAAAAPVIQPPAPAPAPFIQNQVTPGGMNKSATRLLVEDGEVAETDAEGKIWLCPQCNSPDDGSPMVCCDDCNFWFHFACVGLQVDPSENEQWFCPPCSSKRRISGPKKMVKSTKQSASSSRKAKRK